MMTEMRKKLQNKLRRKYGYKTNTNYNRGTILESLCGDIYFCVDIYYNSSINGRNDLTLTIENLKTGDILKKPMTYDELITIGKIAEEMKKEHDLLFNV